MTDSPDMSLTCPECSGTMHLWRLGPVEVDRCGDCGGIWFDPGELAQAVQSLERGAIPPASGAPAEPGTLPSLCCPRCRPPQALEARRWQARLTYGRCPGCAGIYIQESTPGSIDGAVAALRRPPKRLTLGELGTLVLMIATQGLE